MTVKLDMKPLMRIRRQLEEATKSHVKVGFFDSKPHPEEPFGLDLPSIANIQEYGAPEANIPPRPFMSETFRTTRVYQAFKAGLDLLFRGVATDPGHSIWTQAGKFLAKEMSGNIADWSEPANAPRTVAKKGFDDPLIETGFMRDNVEYRVERK